MQPTKKKVNRTLPLKRTLAFLRDRGWSTAVVERWNPHSRTRQDLFGFIDALAHGPERLIAIQACAGDGVSAHVQKIYEATEFHTWVSHTKVFVFGWRKLSSGRVEPRIIFCHGTGVVELHEEAFVNYFGPKLPKKKKLPAAK